MVLAADVSAADEKKKSRAQYQREWYQRNKPAQQAYKRAQAAKNKDAKLEYDRARNLRIKYGITVEERDEIVASQGGVCAICCGPATHVDHCHNTGAVRGVLCSNCNTGIGMLKDSPYLLLSALSYLERANGQQSRRRKDAGGAEALPN